MGNIKLKYIIFSMILISINQQVFGKQTAANKKISESKQAIFTTSSRKGQSVKSIGKILKAHFSSSKEKNKDILIFIHGRGKHPEKGLNIIPKMEDEYKLKLVMFHWPSWKNWHTRPVENAMNASSDLYTFLKEIDKFKKENPIYFIKNKISIIFHSMGNIVLETLMKRHYKGDISNNLFDSVVLNAADIPTKNHHKWLSRLNYGKSIVVTLNKEDAILAGARFLDLVKRKHSPKRLGASIKKIFGLRFHKLAPNAKYFDLDKFSYYGHRHYLRSEKEPSLKMRDMFNSLFHGHSVAPTKANGVYKTRKQGQVYYFKDSE